MKYGLKDATIRKIRSVLAAHPEVEQAVIYGSRARGDYKNGSDIDLTLRGKANLTMRVLYRVMDELDDLLLPYTMDLSIMESIDDLGVLEQIRRHGAVFYDKAIYRSEEEPPCSAKSCNAE